MDRRLHYCTALIAPDLKATFEREGARVLLSRTVRDALNYADHSTISAGVLDFHVGEEDAEPVCEALTRREVPFIFFTGLCAALPERWAATPIVPKPAIAETIIGAIKFVVSPEMRDIIVRSQRSDSRNFGQLDQAIFQGEERIMRCGAVLNGSPIPARTLQPASA